MDRQQMHIPFDSMERNPIMKEDAAIDNSCYYLKCQLYRIFNGAALPLNTLDKIFLKLQPLKLSLDRKINKIKRLLYIERNDEKTIAVPIYDDLKGGGKFTKSEPLKVGDLVQVLSCEEISKLLKEKNKTEGLRFIPGMEKYCGTQARVIKRVNYMFDERENVMRKIKNVVLLEGAICTGEGQFLAQGCERACFLFWKEAWLKKISD